MILIASGALIRLSRKSFCVMDLGLMAQQVYKPYSHVPRQENFAQLKFAQRPGPSCSKAGYLALTWGLILTRLLYLFIKSALSDNFLYSF